MPAFAPPPVAPSPALERAATSGHENSRTVSSSGTLHGGVGKTMGSTANSSSGTTSTGRKRRLQWTPNLHARFVKAVQEIGIDTAVPKFILQRMGTHGLTRENVASHLQKYREAAKKSEGAVNAHEDEDTGGDITNDNCIEKELDKDAASGPTDSADRSNGSWKVEKQESNCGKLPKPRRAIENIQAAGSEVEARHSGTCVQEAGTINSDSSHSPASPQSNEGKIVSSNSRTHDIDR
jgi:SHAQKYF class myb-like DNA-binding protein